MQVARPGGFKSEINVTPLVDVVLVLLIIFMIVAPQLATGTPRVTLPTTERPERAGEDERQIVVGIEREGRIWIDDQPVDPKRFQERMREIAESRSDWSVLIQGDARLTFGEVRQAMLVIESAGFRRIGLVSEPRELS